MPTPVPSLPTCDFPGLVAFKPGRWNGKDYPPAFLKSAADTHHRIKSWHTPYISINHDKFPMLANFKFGALDNVRMERGALTMDARKVPEVVGVWRNSGMLTHPSIEFIEPKRDPRTGTITGGVIGPDGKFVDGPVIKCVTFLGADLPGVSGIDPLPQAVFSQFSLASTSFVDRGGIHSRFGVVTMTREQKIAALAELGLDVSSLTAEVPEQFIDALLAFAQQLKASAPAAPNGDTNTPPPDAMSAFANALGVPTMGAGVPAGAAGAGAAAGAGGAPVNPSQIVLKFHQDMAGIVTRAMAPLTNQLTALKSEVNGMKTATLRVGDTTKKQVIDAAFKRMNDAHKLTEAQAASMRPVLMNLDNVAVTKFSDNGQTWEGTALEKTLRDMEATYPVQRKSGPIITQPEPNGANGKGKMSPERRAALLKGAGAVGNPLVKTPA